MTERPGVPENRPESGGQKPRLLVFVVAYNAERTIGSVLSRIPSRLQEEYAIETLVIDDCSHDRTFEKSLEYRDGVLPVPLHVLFNPVNQGYGGNQKIGYHFAIRNGFEFVALLHGDGQYAPECLPELLRPLRDDEADAVFGSRVLTGSGAALRGGMPLYKLLGNRILTWLENLLLGSSLSEFHSGYRVYATRALAAIPFELNTNDFHFDTEIIVQLMFAGLRIRELSIPTYYGDEICHVDGLKYAWDVTRAVTRAAAQRLGLFYDRRFDCAPPTRSADRYELKLGYRSPHTLAAARVRPGTRVLDLGCAGGGLAESLQRDKACDVTAVDRVPPSRTVEVGRFVVHDLEQGPPEIDLAGYDQILMLDVLEHLSSPEAFVERLRHAVKLAPQPELLASTANIGFFINRLMLLFGQFNYGRRGVLDLTHSRLFTFASFTRLFEQAGFRVVETIGVPGPFPLALGDNALSRSLVKLNEWLIHLSRGLFSYQMFFVVRPLPSLEYLLLEAHHHSAKRLEQAAEGEGS